MPFTPAPCDGASWRADSASTGGGSWWAPQQQQQQQQQQPRPRPCMPPLSPEVSESIDVISRFVRGERIIASPPQAQQFQPAQPAPRGYSAATPPPLASAAPRGAGSAWQPVPSAVSASSAAPAWDTGRISQQAATPVGLQKGPPSGALQASPYPPPSASPPQQPPPRLADGVRKVSPMRPLAAAQHSSRLLPSPPPIARPPPASAGPPAAPPVPRLSLPELVNFLRLHYSTDRATEASQLHSGAGGLASLSEEDVRALTGCLQDELLAMLRNAGLAPPAAPAPAPASAPPSRGPSPAAQPSPRQPRRTQTPVHPDPEPQGPSVADSDWEAALAACASDPPRTAPGRSAIADGLMLGALAAADELAAEGTTHVLWMGAAAPPSDFGMLSGRFHFLSLAPGDDIEAMREAMSFIDSARAQGGAAVVSDPAGGNAAAAAVVIAYLMHCQPAMLLREAATEVLRRRQGIDPSPHLAAVRRWRAAAAAEEDAAPPAPTDVVVSPSSGGSPAGASRGRLSPPHPGSDGPAPMRRQSSSRSPPLSARSVQAAIAAARGRSRRSSTPKQGDQPPTPPPKQPTPSGAAAPQSPPQQGAGAAVEVTIRRPAVGARWGVELQELHHHAASMLQLAQAEPGGAAAAAGLRGYHSWIITHINGLQVQTVEHFKRQAEGQLEVVLQLRPPPAPPRMSRGDSVMVRDDPKAGWELGEVVGVDTTGGAARPTVRLHSGGTARSYTFVQPAPQQPAPQQPSGRPAKAPSPKTRPPTAASAPLVTPQQQPLAASRTPSVQPSITGPRKQPIMPPRSSVPSTPAASGPQTPGGRALRKIAVEPHTADRLQEVAAELSRMAAKLNGVQQRVIKFHATRSGCAYRWISVHGRHMLFAKEHGAEPGRGDTVQCDLQQLQRVLRGASSEAFKRWHVNSAGSVRGFSRSEVFHAADCFTLEFAAMPPLNFCIADAPRCKLWLQFFELWAERNQRAAAQAGAGDAAPAPAPAPAAAAGGSPARDGARKRIG
eukprot:TRINITY_DN20548_c0_g2_i1.p1 TRINITY_DN20548_c0_g2~~TRINITY_DN20548_c0_g2_i1.p1  ORF type:complete len:1036 (+),score=272.84 TRINITY_DN20548_c0_g2_i1:89-3109(+)